MYKPVDPDDPAIVALADSIAEHGVTDPLTVTRDGWIVSGHRRHAAATLAGLAAVPCRVLPRRRDEYGDDEFVRLVREANRQRVKDHAELLREAVLDADPAAAYESLIAHRARRAAGALALPSMALDPARARATITAAKQPFLDAVRAVLATREEFWPLTDRQIHYGLLNDPPLKHAGKPASRYDNTPQSYKNLVDLLTRARLTGLIPWDVIKDTTRPVVTWNAYPDVGRFITEQVDGFMDGYWRDLMAGQPNHVELVAEKDTLHSVLRPVAMQYCLPFVTGRGFCSLPPRYEMAQRYRRSGKDKLVLLIVSDFDPEGESIAESFARSMRDDFAIPDVHAVKVALTAEQVRRYRLPPVMTAKAKSSRTKGFRARHGDSVFEVEALDPKELQRLVRDAVDAVIDVGAFNAQLDAERADSQYLAGVRKTVNTLLAGAVGGSAGGEGGGHG